MYSNETTKLEGDDTRRMTKEDEKKRKLPQDRRIKQIQKKDGTYIHAVLSVQGVSRKAELFELFEEFWKKVERFGE